MPSTAINHFWYAPERRELTIEFITGRRYVYSNVGEGEAERFRAASSKGRYFNAHIRDHYGFRELID